MKLSLYDMKENVNAVSSYMDDVLTFIKENKKEYNKGLDILQLKNYLFLEYLSNLSYIILKKVSSKNIEGDPAIKRTIANRVYLEKMRTLESILRDTIDKHLKMALLTKDNANNPIQNALSLKPNLENMIEDVDGERDEMENGESQVENGKQVATESELYVAPKMMAVPYQGFEEDPDYGSASKAKRKLERSRKDAIKSGMLEELRNQYGDRPEEYSERAGTAKKAIQREIEHRIAYEEDHMVRVNLSKKDRHKMKLLRSSGSNALDEITDFRGYGDMMIEAAEEENYKAKSHYRKRKTGYKGNSSQKGKGGGNKRKSKKRLGKY